MCCSTLATWECPLSILWLILWYSSIKCMPLRYSLFLRFKWNLIQYGRQKVIKRWQTDIGPTLANWRWPKVGKALANQLKLCQCLPTLGQCWKNIADRTTICRNWPFTGPIHVYVLSHMPLLWLSTGYTVAITACTWRYYANTGPILLCYLGC